MLIKGAGKKEISEKRFFLRMMPHKRQSVRKLFNFSLHFTSGNIQIFQRVSSLWKGKKLVTRKTFTLHNYQPVLAMFLPGKSVALALAIPIQDIALCFSCFEIPPRTLIQKWEATLFLESSRNQTNRCLVLAFVLLVCLPCLPSEVPTQRQLLSAPGACQPHLLHNLPHKLFPCLSYIHYNY